MKKKCLLWALVALLLMSVLTGCGGSAKTSASMAVNGVAMNITADGQSVAVPSYQNLHNTVYPAAFNANLLSLGLADGGTAEKPVGLVYIACSIKGRVVTGKYHFYGSRSAIREAAVSAALILMRKCMLEYFSKITFGEI